LRRFIEGDEEPIIAFYGGEPLLNASFMEEVMDEVDWARFVVQTNATLQKLCQLSLPSRHSPPSS